MQKPSSMRVALSAAISALVGLSAQALAQPFEVVDINGAKVGDMIGVERVDVGDVIEGEPEALDTLPLPRIILDLDARPFTLLVDSDGFRSDFPLLFDTTDCTGAPFLVDTGEPLPDGTRLPPVFTPVAITPPDSTVYLPVPGLPSQTVTITSGSLLFGDGTCFPYVNIFAPITASILPAQPITNLNTRFIPPFKVQFWVPPPPPPPLP